MAGNFAIPIIPVQPAGGASDSLPSGKRLLEKSGQGATATTGRKGCPVIISSGYFQESGTITTTSGVLLAGFAQENFHDLASSGVPDTLNIGAPQGQPSAVIIPIGAPASDGKIGVWVCDEDIYFRGSFGTTDAPTLPAITDVGVLYGLTKDSVNGFWYVDKAKTTTSALVEVVDVMKLAPLGVLTAGGPVIFRVVRANQFFNQ